MCPLERVGVFWTFDPKQHCLAQPFSHKPALSLLRFTSFVSFSLEKTKLWGDLIVVFQYLKELTMELERDYLQGPGGQGGMASH